MFHKTLAITGVFVGCLVFADSMLAQSPADQNALARSRYLPEYTDSGELKLPPNSLWRLWVWVGGGRFAAGAGAGGEPVELTPRARPAGRHGRIKSNQKSFRWAGSFRAAGS